MQVFLVSDHEFLGNFTFERGSTDQPSNERIIKTKSGLKVELTTKGGYELVRIYGRKGYVEVYGRKEIQQFVNVLKKNFRIV